MVVEPVLGSDILINAYDEKASLVVKAQVGALGRS